MMRKILPTAQPRWVVVRRVLGAVGVFWYLSLLLWAESDTSRPKWADPRLRVDQGLIAWFDASRLGEARRASGLPALRDGDLVAVWPDSSGAKRDLRQERADAQPSFHRLGDFATLRFDGEKSHLRLKMPGQSAQEMTVFMVVAPFSNREPFAGFLAFSAPGRNDYESGLNIDQGPWPAARFAIVNLEGAGQQGAQNLLKDTLDYGSVARLGVVTSPGKNGTALWLNGKPQVGRDRTVQSRIYLDEFVVGARFYTNGGPPEVRGFYDGDVAELLIYDRALGTMERQSVERYLAEKYAGVPRLPLPSSALGSKPLVRVPKPPPIQMLVPGFTVKQIPVDLPNINNVLYRRDGKLVALGYDGNVYLLSDSDGDGLEDKVELFWENKGRIRGPIGMDLTPPNYQPGNGVFVASKGKCSLLVDTDGRGQANKEIIVADGWTELPHGVDALGVAVDSRDGSVYFGLGCLDYTNAYGVGKKDAERYSLASERGTILRVAPDFKSREIIATGIRFPVGMRFNALGDLFCTDQEGATWLPNGNPLDELLHIQKGRHYGFPPRHPKYLPSVIDEPSTFDYAPQHQSTCGLTFNDPVNDGPIFGPNWWRSDAFIAGYSRGKLYRTKLVKTPVGYVAQNQLLACLNMLACDVCVSPKGDLVVAMHSGGPDWGSGPTGKGRLYKVIADRDASRPVLAWVQSPRELRIAFDKPIAPEELAGVTSGIVLEYGPYVAAGDRFESLWPGYKVVQDQIRTPRYGLETYGVQISADRRTLLIATDVHRDAVGYAIKLGGLGRSATAQATNGSCPQIPETDLAYDLCGVEAHWRPKIGGEGTVSWLPHLDITVARALTERSSDHEELWRRCGQDGALTLRSSLNLRDMLRPQVQPGSKIDYVLPPEQIAVTFRSRAAFTLKAATGTHVESAAKDGGFVATLSAKGTDCVPLEIVLPTGPSGVDLDVYWFTAEDSRPRPLALHRLLLPWARTRQTESAQRDANEVTELKGGNWSRGRAVFFSEQASCSKCHAIFGEGGAIGPDLSNLSHRDYSSVLRDIAEPSFAINPDFITHVILFRDGRLLTGAVRTKGDKLLIGDDKGHVTTVLRSEVEEIQPAKKSIMPEGVPKLLGADKMRDLLTFLLTEPPRMPDYGGSAPPEPRSRKEVAAVLAGKSPVSAASRPLQLVLIASKKDHGPGEHDYPAWQKVWAKLLLMTDGVTVQTAQDWPSTEQFKSADVLIFYQQGKWTQERAKEIDAFLSRGGGLVYLHFAVDGGQDAPGFAQRIGLAWQGGRSRFRHGMVELGFETGARHPIGRNFDKVSFHDESYWRLVGDPKRIELLASGKEDGDDQPLFWTLEPSKGRVFVSILGHFAWTFDDPLFRVLLLRGIAWAAREPVDRFNELVLPGARLKE